MWEAILQGLILGLSTGPLCLAYCGPVFVPFIMAEERRAGRIARVIGELALGRLLAYLAFGVTVGYLGMWLEGPVLQRAVGVALIALSLLMVLYVVLRGWPHLRLCHRVNERYLRFPFLFGLLTGINICPPFLLAISSALGLGDVLRGVLLFGAFFLGTSAYLVLLFPLGYLGRWPSIRIVSWMTALLSSLFFFVMGLVRLVT